MEDNTFKSILKAFGLTILAVTISYFLIGRLLVAAFGYSTVEASYHLPTHALLVGLMFTVIFCTLLILDKFKHK
jgi:hypothetical protein